jgi:CHAD domain-containing protein/CYTH domain-containing protein
VSEPNLQSAAAPPRKTFSEADLDLPASIGAGAVARERLQAMLLARTRFGDKSDTEAMHDFRVEMRRLRTMLRVYGDALGKVASRTNRRGLRRIARATNQARDLEVQLAALSAVGPGLRPRDQTGIRWLVRRLEKQYKEAEKDGERRIAKQLPPLTRTLESDLDEVASAPNTGPSLARSSAVPLAVLIDRMSQELDRTRTVADQTEAHQARVAAKRVRYLLEPFALAVPAAAAMLTRLKSVQEVLGRMHDAEVLSGLVAHAAEDAFQEQTARETARMREGTKPTPEMIRNERRKDPLPGLREVARRAAEMRLQAWEEFETRWLGPREEKLLQPLRTLATSLERRGGKTPAPAIPKSLEIERKFLLSRLPPRAAEAKPVEILQGYLPGEQIQERLRRVTNGSDALFYRTIKTGRGLVREETEETTSAKVFDAMWPLTEGKRVTKRRHKIAEGGLVWEIDAFTDRDLVIAEVELPTPNAAAELPDWLAPYVVREVTEESEYVNINLAK